jgi:hypothetical protein
MVATVAPQGPRGARRPLRRRPTSRYGFGWDGGTGTTWRSDTANDVTGILFTPRAMDSPQPPEVFADFWDVVYEWL